MKCSDQRSASRKTDVSDNESNCKISSEKNISKDENPIPSESESSKTGLQLKDMASNSVYSKLQSLSPNREQYLEITKNLLQDYVTENQLTFKTFALIFIFFVFLLSSITSSLCLFTEMTKFGLFLSAFLLSIIFFVSFFLKLLSSRHEKNAIKAILNDIEKELMNRRFI